MILIRRIGEKAFWKESDEQTIEAAIDALKVNAERFNVGFGWEVLEVSIVKAFEVAASERVIEGKVTDTTASRADVARGR